MANGRQAGQNDIIRAKRKRPVRRLASCDSKSLPGDLFFRTNSLVQPVPRGAGVSIFAPPQNTSAVAVTGVVQAATRNPSMSRPDLRPDCAHCAALCCVAFAFDRSPLFGFDKPAGEPCRHLEAGGACRIHATRAQRGFGGCIRYDCLGAGQRVTQDMFGGRSWLSEPALLGPMMEAFLTLTRAHQVLQLLVQARELPLSASDRDVSDRLEAAIVEAGAEPLAVSALEDETRSFLRGLRPRLEGRPAAANVGPGIKG